MTVAARLAETRQAIADAARAAGRDPAAVQLVAVSKRHPPEAIAAAYDAGQRAFGENYIQELLDKRAALADRCPGIEWHFIGRVQTNKAKLIAQADVVHGVGAARHAEALWRHATRPPRYLLQLNLADEQAKNGFDQEGLADFLKVPHETGPDGLMAMGPLAGDPAPVFAQAEALLARHRDALGAGLLSMGMSADFPVAIRYGATHVRIGTAIFGPRPA